MGVTYFKRFRMEIRLDQRELPALRLPEGYEMVAWDPLLEGAHAEAKFRSFCEEIDANVFPSLAARDGCQRLMNEISHRSGFVAEATWLVVYRSSDGQVDYCGTVQGVRDELGAGWIQNLGIAPEHRGRQLGTALLSASLAGFKEVGVQRVYLEVTAQNHGAIRLYERIGFCSVKTSYKASQFVMA